MSSYDINPALGQNPKYARTRSAPWRTRSDPCILADDRQQKMLPAPFFFFFFSPQASGAFFRRLLTHESPLKQRWQAAAAAAPPVHALMGRSRRGSGAAGAGVEAQRMTCSLVPQPPVRRAARSPSLPLMWASLARPLCVDKNVRSGYGMQRRAGVPPLRRPASSRHPRGCNHRCLCAGSAATARPGRPFS